MSYKKASARADDPKIYTLVVVSLLSTIAAVVFGILNALQIPALFHHSIAVLSSKYFNELTPAGFVFGVIWPLIYLFILAGSIYLFVSLFLHPNQSPVNHQPTLTPTSYLIAASIGCLGTVAWLFAFDRELLIPSFALLLLSAYSVWQAISSSLAVVFDNLEELEVNSRTMLLVVRILIHNGLCLFASWLTVATIVGFSIALIYVDSPGMDTAQLRGLVTQEDGSTIALVILFVIVIAAFIMVNFTHEKHFRYVFTIFPVFVFALIGIVVQLSSLGAYRNLQIASIELGVSIVCLITRIVLSVFKFLPQSNEKSGSTDKLNLLADA